MTASLCFQCGPHLVLPAYKYCSRANWVPLSWHKLYLARQVRWIGWLFELNGRLCATLPEDKVARLTTSLRAVARAGSSHDRWALESLCNWASVVVHLWCQVAEALDGHLVSHAFEASAAVLASGQGTVG